MFRYRSHGIRLLGAALAICGAVCAFAQPKTLAQTQTSYTASPRTLTGIDVLEAENFSSLRGKRVGPVRAVGALRIGLITTDRSGCAGAADD